MCRVLLDTGSDISSTSSTLLQELSITPTRKGTKTITMILHTTTKKIEVFDIDVWDFLSNFTFINILNFWYEEMVNQCLHMKSIKVNNTKWKSSLPIHVILGQSEYWKIKAHELSRIDQPGEPIAELTKFRGVMPSPGRYNNDKKCRKKLLPMTLINFAFYTFEPMTEGEVIHQVFKNQLI